MTQDYAVILKQLPVCLIFKPVNTDTYGVSDEFRRQFEVTSTDCLAHFLFFNAFTGAAITGPDSPLVVAEQAQDLCQRVHIVVGTKRYTCIFRSSYAGDEQQHYLVIRVDIDDVQDMEARTVNSSLASHLSFSMLLSSISTQLINATFDQTDALIEQSLGSFGQFFNADRCYLFRFSADKRKMDNTHEWVAPGVVPYKDELQQIPLEQLPYFEAAIKADMVFKIDDVQTLPAEASLEKAEFEREGIRAVLCVAVYLNDDLFGFIGCDMLSNVHHWRHYEVRYLKLIGEMVSETLISVNNRRSLQLLQKELLEANKALEKQVNIDGLTGIANRRLFDMSLARDWSNAQFNRLPLSLMIIDVDFFKRYNDTYGHVSGDEALQKIAQAINATTRTQGGLTARYGGEEFAVILPSKTEQTCFVVAQHILEAVRSLNIAFSGNESLGVVTVSIGCASTTQKASETIPKLIKRADDALYQAKSSGRNQVSFATAKVRCPA
ncbi:sensor domain-containing diguanylate cyclase [Salinimonas marina]|uniref:diguanylate cyclase n=1 Tax=Salinimonas marina TaxID=2785918 RepID=A0A7S9DWL3_9ALTE|nr:GGDEF domain-containing protein [Salinimonas marina]QPG05264.1 sensor domain-containing diguanylate cyclase [Salinimonas marina]